MVASAGDPIYIKSLSGPDRHGAKLPTQLASKYYENYPVGTSWFFFWYKILEEAGIQLQGPDSQATRARRALLGRGLLCLGQ